MLSIINLFYICEFDIFFKVRPILPDRHKLMAIQVCLPRLVGLAMINSSGPIETDDNTSMSTHWFALH